MGKYGKLWSLVIHNPRLKYYLSFVLLGILSGVASSVFLYLLKVVTTYRLNHSWIIFFLPFVMLIVNMIYRKVSPISERGNNLIIDEIHNPQKKVPLVMVPLILFSTLLSHLFGASVGREGSAVQMGGVIASHLAKVFNFSDRKRSILLMAGCGAGFGAAIGAPLAGAFFGMEAIYLNVKLRASTFLECLVASYIGYYTTVLLRTPHSLYEKLSSIDFSFTLLGYSLIAGLCFGLISRSFIFIIENSKKGLTKKFKPLVITFVGSLVLVTCYFLIDDFNRQRCAGLGIEVIQTALLKVVEFSDSIYKFILTIISLVSGIKGGEFTPLVYIGTAFGSSLSGVLGISPELLAALGFCVVFGAASNTPIACFVMGVEIFGLEIVPYLFVAMAMGQLISSRATIYSSQILKKVN